MYISNIRLTFLVLLAVSFVEPYNFLFGGIFVKNTAPNSLYCTNWNSNRATLKSVGCHSVIFNGTGNSNVATCVTYAENIRYAFANVRYISSKLICWISFQNVTYSVYCDGSYWYVGNCYGPVAVSINQGVWTKFLFVISMH
jgi:hypothetical protein